MARRVHVERLDTYYHHLESPRTCAHGRDLDTGDLLDVWLDAEASARVMAVDCDRMEREPLVLDDVPEDWCAPAR